MTRLTLGQARRVALVAQGFTDSRPEPGRVSMRHIQRVVDRVSVVQIDSVNVVSRSQYLPFYSRLGPFDTALLDRARDEAPQRLVEYWAHEASLIAPQTWPLLTFRMRRAEQESWGGMARVAREQPELVAAVLEEVQRRGPLTARQAETALEHDRSGDRTEWGWNWSLVKNALEHLFWAGRITSAGRTTSFERRYAPLDLVAPRRGEVRERWLNPQTRSSDEEAFIELTRMAARALGVGTEQCLRDYFRLRPEQARPAIAALVAAGEVLPVEVTGWRRPAYLLAGTRIPRRIRARALLSPFDSLIWTRARTRALFDFDYRLEIYVPAHLRVHGYYVLPFLLDDRLVARCDLKADRAAGTLRVHGVHWEHPPQQDEARALDAELDELAGWLGLGSVTWSSAATWGGAVT